MAKFNEVQKKKRAQKAERKRAIHGDPATGKLKNKPQPLSISGKRKRKLLKKWRREQNEAVQKGLITMQDIEMAAADDDVEGGEESKDTKKTSSKFPMKKSLKLKQLKRKGKKGKSSKPVATAQASVDAMVVE